MTHLDETVDHAAIDQIEADTRRVLSFAGVGQEELAQRKHDAYFAPFESRLLFRPDPPDRALLCRHRLNRGEQGRFVCRGCDPFQDDPVRPVTPRRDWGPSLATLTSNLPRLSSWERTFVASISEQYAKKHFLTPGQQAKLTQILSQRGLDR